MSTEPVPPSAADALGNDGPLPVVRWNGAEYPVAHPTPAVLAAVEAMVSKLAWDATAALKGVFGPQEWADLRAETVAAIQARRWAFGQPLFNETLSGPDGNALILWGCLSAKTPGVTLAQVKRMMAEAADDCEFALAAVQLGFFLAGAATMPLPPERAAAMKQAVAASLASPSP